MTGPPPATAPKADWRGWARTLDRVDSATADAVARSVGEFLADVHGDVLGYAALDDEVPCPPGATALPRLADDGSMTLHRTGALERHRFGIDQPVAESPIVAPSALVAVLVPARVFDRDGYRLGRGGGHYDRLLPHVGDGVPIVGITCAERVVIRLPREPHDVPMTHLATEDGLTSTR